MAADSQIASVLQQLLLNDKKATAELTTQTYENLLNHILLPRFISANAQKELFGQEISLLSRLCETVTAASKWLPTSTVDLIKSFERVHQSNESEETIYDELNKLKPGQTFAMFVRQRNTVFMCHMPTIRGKRMAADKLQSVNIATFEGQIDPKDIYSNPMDSMVCRSRFEAFNAFIIQLIIAFFQLFLSVCLSRTSNHRKILRSFTLSRIRSSIGHIMHRTTH